MTKDTCISHNMEQRRAIVTLGAKTILYDCRPIVQLSPNAIVRRDYRPNPINHIFLKYIWCVYKCLRHA